MDKEEFRDSLKKYLNGDYTKDEMLKRYIPMVLGVFLALIAVALALYPPAGEKGPYSIFTHSISSLGDWSYTKVGWVFFSIALVWIGLTVWPVVPYTYQRLVGICKHTSRFAAFFGVLSPVGLVLTAIFAENSEPIPGAGGTEFGDIHGPVAVLGFGGLAFALLFFTCPILKDHFRGEKSIPLGRLLPQLVWFIFVVFGTLGTQGALSVVDIDHCSGFSSCDPIPYLAWGFWEWMLMISLLVYLPSVIWVLPANPGESETSRIEGERAAKREARERAKKGARKPAGGKKTAPDKFKQLKILLREFEVVPVGRIAELLEIDPKFLMPLLDEWSLKFQFALEDDAVVVNPETINGLVDSIESEMETWKKKGKPAEWRI
ncbi:MAG: hypothetical protein ACTSU5_12265 [Promethearchaeota archaeon]